MPQETEQRRLSAIKSMQNIIDSIIYAMYIQERILSTFGEVGLDIILNIAFILFSPMPQNKQGEFKEMIVMRCIMKRAYNDGWAEDCGFGMF